MADEEDDDLPDFSKDPTVTRWGSVDHIWAVCPYEDCGKTNWVYLGRPGDQTAPDREVLRCFGCDKLSWLSEEIRDEAVYYGQDSIEDFYDEKGQENPPGL